MGYQTHQDPGKTHPETVDHLENNDNKIIMSLLLQLTFVERLLCAGNNSKCFT